jgi:hypothetical protein
MTTEKYPWYDIVEGDELEQGDIIPGCPCFLPIGKLEAGSGISFKWEDRDLIVLSQSCDLVRGREKLADVLLAAVWKPSDLSGHLATTKGLEDARRGNLPSVHLLAECLIGGMEPGVRVVDFRSVFTLPLAFLREQARSSAKRLRLLPPYREHLSQAFARFFMRVGLPVDIPAFK